MSERFAYNPASTSLVVDPNGSTLGGGEWGTVDDSHKVVKAALHSGALVLPETAEPVAEAPAPAPTTAEKGR